MKTFGAKFKREGFTLLELLVVIAVIAVLAAMLLPGRGTRVRATGIACMSNQKQIALGFLLWKSDHGEKFPWQVSVTTNGTMESSDRGYAAPNFSVVTDYIKNPQVFVCPTDETKIMATNLVQIHNQNISYFVGLDQGTNAPESILTGDRHLQANGKAVKFGLFVYLNSFSMGWTRELHAKNGNAPFGVLSFADGHAEIVRTTSGNNLNSIFLRQGSITNRFCFP